MGTDIHGVVQYRYSEEEVWSTSDETFEDTRNYLLFAVLGDVRNGFGFAGCKLFEPVRPLQNRRGLPDGLTEYVCPEWEREARWLGDHSHGWLLLDELAEKEPWNQAVEFSGVVSRALAEAWDGHTRPLEYCGDASGPYTLVWYANQPEPEEWTHKQITWTESIGDRCRTFLAWAEWIRLRHAGAQVRIVFGFDS